MAKRGRGGGDAELLLEKWLWFLGYAPSVRVHRFRPARVGGTFSASCDGWSVLDFGVIYPQLYEVAKGGEPTLLCPWAEGVGCQAPNPLDGLLAVAELGMWGINVTTQGSRAAHRTKFRSRRFPSSWRLDLFTHEATEDPANRARRKHYWKIEQWTQHAWEKPIAVEFNLQAVTKYWKDTTRERKALKEGGLE